MTDTMRCFYCGSNIGPKADIAICSECRRPHHLSCWSSHGHCSTPCCSGSPLGRPPEPEAAVPSDEASGQAPAAEGTRKCPFCAEIIRADAIKCRYCQSMLYQSAQPTATYGGSQFSSRPGSAPYVQRYEETRNPDTPSSGLMTFLYIVTFFIPIVGIIVGAIYSSRSDEETKSKGKSLLTFGIIMAVIACICGLFNALS